MRPAALFTLLCVPLPYPAAADPVCVANAAGVTLFLVAETEAARIAADTPPGGALCLPGPGPATLWAYPDETAFEGCGRRVAGGTWAIDAYQGVDLCLWSERG